MSIPFDKKFKNYKYVHTCGSVDLYSFLVFGDGQSG
jgi:hypothetical protein